VLLGESQTLKQTKEAKSKGKEETRKFFLTKI
jgi:hypothetical protein